MDQADDTTVRIPFLASEILRERHVVAVDSPPIRLNSNCSSCFFHAALRFFLSDPADFKATAFLQYAAPISTQIECAAGSQAEYRSAG